jgi:hypothetical protein
MVTPLSRANSATATPAAETPVKTNGKLIQPLKLTLNIDTAKSIFNGPLKSQNAAVRGLEVSARATMAAVVAIFEVLGHLVVDAFKVVANAGIIPYVAIRDRNKDKPQTEEVEMAPVTAPTDAEARRMEEQPLNAKAEAPLQPAQKGIRGKIADGLQTMKDHPFKTAFVVAAVAAATTLCLHPTLAATISSKLASAASSFGFGGGYAGSYAGGYAGNYAGGYAGNYAGYAGTYAGNVVVA